MRRKTILSMIALGVAACALWTVCGCGYTTRGFTYQEDSIFITPVVNKVNITSEGRKYSGYASFPRLLEKKLTNALVNEFNVGGQLKVASASEQSLGLVCVIKDYKKSALRYTDSDEVREQRLRLRIQMKLTDSAGTLLRDRDVVGEATFFLSGPNRKSEEAAQAELVDDTARRIAETVVEQW